MEVKLDLMNKINCGDTLDLMKNIESNSVHLAITSPPYNVGKEYDEHNDLMMYEEYLDWLSEVWIETQRVLIDGGRFALNIGPTGIRDFKPLHHDLSNRLREIGMIFRTEILWYKQTMLKRTAWGSWKSPSNPHIIPSWEYVLIFSNNSMKLEGDKSKSDITRDEFLSFSDGHWNILPVTKNRKGHPAPFPEELIYRLIKYYSYEGNTVLDMVGGTGTVASVASNNNRNFIHIDISKEYCKIASERIMK